MSGIRIHSRAFHALLDCSVAPNIMSFGAVERISIIPEEATRVFTIVDAAKFEALGKLTKTSVLFGEIQTDLDFFFLGNIYFKIVIGPPPSRGSKPY